MKLQIEFDLSEREATYWNTHSLERVINNAMNQALKNHNKDEDAAICYEDLESWKPLLMQVWHKVFDAVFKASQN